MTLLASMKHRHAEVDEQFTTLAITFIITPYLHHIRWSYFLVRCLAIWKQVAPLKRTTAYHVPPGTCTSQWSLPFLPVSLELSHEGVRPVLEAWVNKLFPGYQVSQSFKDSSETLLTTQRTDQGSRPPLGLVLETLRRQSSSGKSYLCINATISFGHNHSPLPQLAVKKQQCTQLCGPFLLVPLCRGCKPLEVL